VIAVTPLPASAPHILAFAPHEPISSANPKFKIKNPRVSVSTPYSCRGRERGAKLKIQNRCVTPLTPFSLNPLTPRYCVAAFTLVELLAVIGIMGLLAAVGVPALKGLTGSGGRKQALSQVMGAIEIARNTAISTGTNAAVIFPDSTFASGDAYKYRSMAVVAWNATNSNLPTTMVGSWIVLPQGVAFFPNSLKSANLPTAKNISVRILTANNTANFPAIIFQPDGGLSEDYSPLPTNGIAFFEGTVNGTTPNTNSKMTNFETVRLTRYTGRALPTLATNP
jgi:type II secretory pathway pseudopilin PulG